MKKIIITAVLALGALSLFGCHTAAFNHEKPLQAMQQSYSGVLPCADCSGLKTSLFLQQDGTYILQEVYQGSKEGDQSFASYGRWARTADKLVLTDSRGEKRYFHPKDENLEMLDQSGEPIVSSFNYTLKPVQQSLPKTPMALTGMMQYSADAASFKDCATGNIFPMSANKTLEAGYLAARKVPNQLVFISMDGHFMTEPSMEEGQMQRAVVADKNISFDANKVCP
ncbi:MULTISPECIES: envelope stress response activation lipoprotein NlpE [Rahnella]|uniref:envelope stress response activation lipoprotein NlpE n=1 Tax=Rahnella TaxID=34037 RepID=UPI0018A25A7A|nr:MULTISPECIES: envelope stress response activation lipoprotein NlpE [Rahnella]MBF7996961.1 envelope stress response activation lipoprotein NlpE [Rahnella laticis]MBV6821041.1 envelope stress response activation lipoprotein NlpE [Rahnella sp. PD12R]